MDTLKISFGDKIVTIKITLFKDDAELEIDRILQIDYVNLIAEIATFPVILNRWGVLLADANNRVSEAELDLRIFKAKIREKIRNELEAAKAKITGDIVDDKMRSSPIYMAKYKRLNNITKEKEYVNSIYWGLKSKDDKLQKLSLTIQPGDIDLAHFEKSFNGVKFRFTDALIK